MKLEDGCFYRQRNGEIVGPVKKINDTSYDFWIPNSDYRSYTKGGKTCLSGWIENPEDLVEKIDMVNLVNNSWNKIDSAPRDGTQILAIENFKRIDNNGREYPKEYCVVKWSKNRNGWIGYGLILASFEPTHWMPLPEPPKQ